MVAKRVRVHYRRYYRGSEPAFGDPLSGVVSAALGHKIDGVALDDDVGLRTCVDPDYGCVIMNGRFLAANGDVYGELVRFDPETNVPLLMQNPGSKAELEVRELAKPNDDEVLRGTTFFLLRQDHVLVIEQDLTNTIMERYLRWLLCDRTCLAGVNGRVALIPTLFLGEQPEMVPDVTGISLRPAPVRVDEFDLGRGGTAMEGALDAEAGTDVLGILRAAHFDTIVIERIMRENSAAVEVSLKVVLKTGRSRSRLRVRTRWRSYATCRKTTLSFSGRVSVAIAAFTSA